MNRLEALSFAAQVNHLGWARLGRMWTNPGVGENDWTVSVRNADGAETELAQYPENAGEALRLLDHCAHARGGKTIEGTHREARIGRHKCPMRGGPERGVR